MTKLTGRTILIVDDEPDLLAVTAEVLEFEGARTLRAGGGHAALALAKSERIDAIVSDVRMPEGTGLDLLKGLATLPERPPVSLITGFAELSLDQAYGLGAQAVLSKPCNFTQLVTQVERMLTPRERRWTVGDADTPGAAELAVPALDQLLADGRVVLGTHGLFVRWTGEPPRAQTPLRLRFAGGPELVVIVRWVRPQDTDGLPAGWGAEILAMDIEVARAWRARLDLASPVAFIPRG